MKTDEMKIRELAKKYAAIASDGVNAERTARYRRLNNLECVRPPVLVFEIPWGEFNNCTELRLQCEDAAFHGYEWHMNTALYQWNNFCGDYALHPYWRSPAVVGNSGIGLSGKEEVRGNSTGSYVISHKYEDVLCDEEALEKVVFPKISYDETATKNIFTSNQALFNGILPVGKAGVSLYLNSWDVIALLRGMENSLIDLYDNPDFIHKIMEKFTQIHEYEIKRYDELNVFDTDPYYIHCTPACTFDLPYKNMDTERITSKDVWCRAMAQPLAVVSPEMFKEFDLDYTERLFAMCGLSYYGCCEPLSDKIELLRRFPNLRRISITPWADVDVAAEKIGGDYVLSYKSNPAYVGEAIFHPEPVIAETTRVLEACRRNNTPCEFIIKDISTVANHPENLTRWVETVSSVIDRYY